MPRKRDDPLQYASGYSLDLYCDHEYTEGECQRHAFNEFPHQYNGETFSQCAKAARSQGWKINVRDRTATCPACMKVLR